ncbi:GNAT family N-acetyltransferase [Hymenobacter sediminis]|uniref:GNAT family N-acetyltransferase n=1 Tax=Hymenobacter sediminis TaxID=2218621 RepID=UPI000DA65625|nr:GNAT family N-acetyltransferase [Hymenobacter sediminis]RPD46873.1 GNAT family N-acetyltransferase [Hymenobacter sediminis]
MLFREAQLTDIPQLSWVRLSVQENRLSDPGRITVQDYTEYLSQRGKCWVCEVAGEVVGFGIADLVGRSIWALFVQPEFAGQGIGKQLHDRMLDWYFGQTTEPVWLRTDPGSRAEEFYRRRGWQDTGRMQGGEIRFEMTVEVWKGKRATHQPVA